ncbi:DMT family transporter [uncultured Clostridium sp.]|jgi:drug/metabolite transporter (DMT)-like permease|uniref:DMT family transporter n=1 Tax=uncultured Clostridium sp. TaxID=59620 RepID=UPI0026281D0C|nr:DMT family transporter [uncultured Clostridium sp.]
MSKLNKGILLLLISSLGYAGMSFFIKLAGNDIPIIQKIFFRNLLTFFIAIYFVIKKHDSFIGHHGNRKILLLRGVIGTFGALANFYGVEHLLLPNAVILNQLGPFFIIILSFVFLKEKIKKFQIGALVIAFLGIIVIIGPSGGGDLTASFVEILGAISIGIVFTCIRYLSDKESPQTIVFWFSAMSIFASLPFVIFDYHYMNFTQVIYLLLAGVCTVFGQFGATLAYKFAPAKDISIFGYSQVLFATLLSAIFFDALPTKINAIGYAVVIGAALISFIFSRRDRLKN